MGRKRTPNVLHLIRGLPGKRPLPPEPVAPGNLQEPPSWFTDSQKEGWKYAIEHAPASLLKMIDRSILTIWTIAESYHREASQKVSEFGMLVKTPISGQPAQSPYLPIVNRQAHIMMAAAIQLGFTPTARPGITAPPSGNAFDRNGRRPTDPDAA